MATYYRDMSGFEVQKSEATAAYRTVFFEVGSAEAQTVTVSKNGAAFASASATASQVDGNVYKLEIAATDIDTAGVVAFKCVGATDTQYLLNIRVVDHDPVEAVQDILDDTSGTDGVAIADGAITAAKIAADAVTADKIADDAIGADQLATDAIGSDALATSAVGEIADGVWDEARSGHTTAGTFGEGVKVESLNTQAKADVNAECDTALTDYDPPTKAEMDTGFAGLNDPSSGDIADAVLEELVSDHKSTAGGLADVLNDIWRREGCGLLRWDTSTNTIKTYDGDSDTDTVLLTQTRSTSGTETDYTPS